MLLRSSKRAFSSTSTATCLPCSAASISRSTSGEFGADAVERHLDRDHVRVVDRGAQERLDRRERVERVVDQEVLIGDLLEDLVGLVRRPQRARRERRVLQRRAMQLASARSSRRSPGDRSCARRRPRRPRSSRSGCSARAAACRLRPAAATARRSAAASARGRRSRAGRPPRLPGSPCRCRG